LIPPFRGNPFGGVVEVAPPVGPAHIVEDEHGKGSARPVCRRRQHQQLVVHRVPVVVAVDDHHIRGRQLGQHVEARPQVEVVPARERPLVVRRVELRGGIDDVQLAARPQSLEHPDGGLAPERADLYDATSLHRVYHRCDDVFPQREHPQAALPTVPRSTRR
jgi:hypothetical protein